MQNLDGRRRVIVEGVSPEIDCGVFPIKRVAGEKVVVTADIFSDGHDMISAVVLFRRTGDETWREAAMRPLGHDRWAGDFVVAEMGEYEYTLEAWVDHFLTWHHDLGKRIDAGQELAVEFQIGARMVAAAIERAAGHDRERLRSYDALLRSGDPQENVAAAMLGGELLTLMSRSPDRSLSTRYGRELRVIAERPKARFSSWYELFPRSTSSVPGRHGTFRDVEARLPYVASLGFDVLYMPPIHPIGRTFRKGPNNSTEAQPKDPGSPWAIGGAEGGHTAIHPELGTIDDFRSLLKSARDFNIELALDIAFQASPDHPWVSEHEEWFRKRPDGTIQYAENPPKKYQDIYPFEFESEQWKSLWCELRDVFLFWIGEGVRIFRVDNPHTKPLPFWQWVIEEIRRDYPDVIFLAEAFTRPRIMYRLAKAGFTQSYTYFTWRNAKWEIEQYFSELTGTEVREYFRPNAWPTTPDILSEYLQYGGRPAFMSRIVLAATLCASYGIYGPAYELGENQPREHGSEEFLNSEKYQLRQWDLERQDSLAEFIARLNVIRRSNPALQVDSTLKFHPTTNDQLICYSKVSLDGANVIIVVVNLDPYAKQAGWLDLSLEVLKIDAASSYQVHDLLSNTRFLWFGPRNYVELDSISVPAHIFAIRRRARTEHDFDYFL